MTRIRARAIRHYYVVNGVRLKGRFGPTLYTGDVIVVTRMP